MKCNQSKSTLVRFDVNLNKADDINNIPFTLEPIAIVGQYKQERKFSIKCRYRIYATNKNNEEVIGYLREFNTPIVEFGTIDTDILYISTLCKSCFINVELDFQQKISPSSNFFSVIRPPFDKMAQSVLAQLIELGCYEKPR